ncbi:MAG: DUF2568 domain-containing protein [Bacteroidota bacterium]|nr:DUF2568 domain-containing protein [Bacteroidota bacterium]
MTFWRGFNLFLRGAMEPGVVAGFAYYGYHAGTQIGIKILQALLFPLIGFGFWGLVDFHQFERCLNLFG